MHRSREVPEDERLLFARQRAGPSAGVLPSRGRAAELVLRGDEIGSTVSRGDSSQAEEGTDREEGPLLRQRLRPEVRGEPDGGQRGSGGEERERVQEGCAGRAL